MSSTFSDLVRERDALLRIVVPQLRRLCRSKGADFQWIDLRWGVSEEAAFDNQTLNICLAEIAHCQSPTWLEDRAPRPNFIVLLGERYGSQAAPPQIEKDEFDSLRRAADGGGRLLLRRWYRLDRNAVPPSYSLKPRNREFKNGERWREEEAALLTVLAEAADRLDLPAERRIKFEASITEQEVIQGAIAQPDANEHVFCFQRSIRHLNRDEHSSRFREGDPWRQDRLQRLRQSIQARGIHVDLYQADWDDVDGVSEAHIGSLPADLDKCLALLSSAEDGRSTTLCVDVWRRLAKVILDEIARLDRLDWNTEVEAHRRFGEERRRSFEGRQDALAQIREYFASPVSQTLVVTGEGGVGKSALLAQAAAQAKVDHPNTQVLVRFVGATPESRDIRSLLFSLCQEMIGAYSPRATSVPLDYPGLRQEFTHALATATKPVILLLDGLDQLSDAAYARRLGWLPVDGLAARVHVVVSMTPGECLRAIEPRLAEGSLVKLGPLSKVDADRVLASWLHDAHRTLQLRQRSEVLSKFEISGGLPLYLRLAFEEARLWRSHESRSLAPGVQGIIERNLLPRLSRAASHGGSLVAYALGYLTAGRDGLAEEELVEVLSRQRTVLRDIKTRHPWTSTRDSRWASIERLPDAIWARLYFDLAPYLGERLSGGRLLLSFYHRQLGEAIGSRYRKLSRHRELASYLSESAALPEAGMAITDLANQRCLSELPYQLAKGGQRGKLRQLLTDYTFIAQKVSLSGAGGPYDAGGSGGVGIYRLLQDYELDASVSASRGCRAWHQFLRANAHFLSVELPGWGPGDTLRQLAFDWSSASIRRSMGNDQPRIYRRFPATPEAIPAALAVFKGHRGAIRGAVQVKDDLILSWGDDETIRTWGTDGTPILEWHAGDIHSISRLADGAIEAWADGIRRVWDPAMGGSLPVRNRDSQADGAAREVGHKPDWRQRVEEWDSRRVKRRVDAVERWVEATDVDEEQTDIGDDLGDRPMDIAGAIPLSDSIILSWGEADVHSAYSFDKHILRGPCLCLWKAEEGQLAAILIGHLDEVLGACQLRDRTILSWSADRHLRVWAPTEGTGFLLQGHSAAVTGALELADGRIVSWSDDSTLRSWDRRETGKPFTLLDVTYDSDDPTVLEASDVIRTRDRSTLVAGEVVLEELRPAIDRRKFETQSLESEPRGESQLEVSSTGLLSAALQEVETALETLAAALRELLIEFPMSAEQARLDARRAEITSQISGIEAQMEDVDNKIDDLMSIESGAEEAQRVEAEIDRLETEWDRLSEIEDHLHDDLEPVEALWARLTAYAQQCIASDPELALRLAELTSKWDSLHGEHERLDQEYLAELRSERNAAAYPQTLTETSKAAQATHPRSLKSSNDSVDHLGDREAADIHAHQVRGAIGLKDGRILSWSEDRTVRMWQPTTPEAGRIFGPWQRIGLNGAIQLDDGRIAGWTNMELIALHPSGELAFRHGCPVEGALQLSDRRILTWSDYGFAEYSPSNLDVWRDCLALREPMTGNVIREWYTDWMFVQGVRQLVNGELLTWGRGRGGQWLMRVWDLVGDEPVREWPVKNVGEDNLRELGFGVAQLRDGRVVSWRQNDSELQIWDPLDGTLVDTLNVGIPLMGASSTQLDDRYIALRTGDALVVFDVVDTAIAAVWRSPLTFEPANPVWVPAGLVVFAGRRPYVLAFSTPAQL